MMSARPKPLHRLCGRPMVLHVIDALAELHVQRIVVVVGHGAERVVKTVTEGAPEGVILDFVEQPTQRGTGDAVSVGVTALPDADDEDGDVIVLPGDTPLLRPATIAALVRQHRGADAAATLLTAEVTDPYGYGRVVRAADGRVHAHCRRGRRRHRRARHQRGQHVDLRVPPRRARTESAPVMPDNVKGEYYLTDVIGVLFDAGYKVTTLEAADSMEAAGVNDRGGTRGGRGRTARPHQRALDASRRDDARSRAHLRRRVGRTGYRRDLVSGHDPARPHRHR